MRQISRVVDGSEDVPSGHAGRGFGRTHGRAYRTRTPRARRLGAPHDNDDPHAYKNIIFRTPGMPTDNNIIPSPFRPVIKGLLLFRPRGQYNVRYENTFWFITPSCGAPCCSSRARIRAERVYYYRTTKPFITAVSRTPPYTGCRRGRRTPRRGLSSFARLEDNYGFTIRARREKQ